MFKQVVWAYSFCMKGYTSINSQDDVKNLQADMDKLLQWSRTWLLKFNASKFKVIHMGYSNPGGSYMMDHGWSNLRGDWAEKKLKGALDKYNIYLFIYNSKEYLRLNQYRNFQLILPMHFHFMRYFVNSIIFRVSHRLLCCVFIEVNFEK